MSNFSAEIHSNQSMVGVRLLYGQFESDCRKANRPSGVLGRGSFRTFLFDRHGRWVRISGIASGRDGEAVVPIINNINQVKNSKEKR